MKGQGRTKKGVTLAEICVVLAVISIMSLMVVSFSLMVSQRTRISQARLSAMEDISTVQSLTEGWIDAVLEQGMEIFLSSANDALVAQGEPGGPTYTLSFSEGGPVAMMPAGGTAAFHSSVLTGMTFDLMKKDNDALYFCTVTYAIPLTGGEPQTGTFTFCVNPHVGEVLAASTGGANG